MDCDKLMIKDTDRESEIESIKHWENKEDAEEGETGAADTEKIMCMKILIH